MSILSGKVTLVKIGHLEIEGILIEDGSFGIAVPQIAMLFPYFKTDKNNASTMLKRLMGKDFKTDRIKSEFNKNIVTSIRLIDFERLLRKLDKASDPVADKLLDGLIGLSLTQLFSDAFNIKFEKDERNLWLKQRQEHYSGFHPRYTDWLKKDAGGDSYIVDWALEVNSLKRAANLPLRCLDTYNEGELRRLNEAETEYNAYRKIGMTHQQALSSL